MNTFIAKTWRPVLVLLLLFCLWEAAVRYFEIEDWLLPSPSAIFHEAVLSWDTFSIHAFAPAKLSVTGFFIGSAVGLILAIILHRIVFFR